MIVCEDLRFAYEPQGPDAVAGLSLTIADGEHLAVLGRNGSGKSTLARLFNGLLRPTGGGVRVDGLDVADASVLPDVRRAVQLVFQNPENQQVGTTVFDDIAFGLANIGVPTADMPGQAASALAEVGLSVGLDRDVNTLSGGELQRLALASVTALRPRHLILDEVTSMLDPMGREQVLAAVARLREASGLTVVQITHHLDEIEGAERVVVLDRGQVRAEGSLEEILADSDLLDACGLEAPYRWRRVRPAAPRPEPDAPAEAIVEASGVGHDYSVRPGRRWSRRRPAALVDPVLLDVDLALAPGELVAVAGRSGAGKSTLVSIVKGLIRPTIGAVLVEGRDPWLAREPERFDSIGYVFQQPEHQLFAPTVRADVGFGLKASGLPADEIGRRVDAQLRRLGLDPDELGDRSPFGLSGGQQRRVAFAGVFVTEPRVLILDEPTAGLDAPSRETLFAILSDARAGGVCVVWVSHRLEEILQHAGRLVALDAGRLVADGPPSELLADEGLRGTMGWPLLPELDPAVGEGSALAEFLARSGPAPEVA